MSPSVRVSKRQVRSFVILFGLALVLALGAAQAYGQPAILQNFDGTDYATSGWIPPDPNLAAGPNHVVEMVNGAGRVWDKSGGLVKTFSLDTFFGFSSGTYVTDPVIHFDAMSGRWFASIASTTALNLAVSQSNDPTGFWWVYHFNHSDRPDYPRMGLNDDKVVVSYLDLLSGNFIVYILNKSELTTGSAADFVIYSPGTDAGTLQPVVSLTGTTTEYMIDNSFTSSLTLYSITGLPGVSAANISTMNLPFRPTQPPPDAKQPGTSIGIDTLDDRLLSAVWRDGSLWTSAHEGCTPPGDTIVRSCLRLIEATTAGTPLPPNSIRFAAIGDLNGDGKPDLAVANAGNNAVSVLLGDGAGSFGPPADFAAGSGPQSLAIADLNGDGKKDAVVISPGTNAVSVLLGDGAGSFGPPVFYSVGHLPQSLAIGDLNADGKPDVVVADANDNKVTVLLGNGDGTFTAAPDVSVGSNPLSVAIGDLNGDGKPDLAVANFSSNTVSILLGDGAGSFGSATSITPGSGPETVAIADLNGDGKTDLAVANFYSNTVSIFIGNGTGSFGSHTDFPAGSAPAVVVAGDLNGDGKPDLAVTNVYSSSVSILLGNGTGSFGAAANFGAGGSPASLAMGDLNGDGKQDLAMANPGANSVSLLFGDGTGSFGPPSIVGWDPGPHVVQDMTYGSTGYYYFYPAIVTDAAGNLEVVFGRSSSSTEYAGVRVAGRLQNDSINTLQASSLLQSGLTANTSGRWGDYYGAALDPSDTSKVWVVGEYAKISTYGWGTRIAQLGFGGNVWGLTVTKSGTGSGTVTSSPSGINCGTDCSEVYSQGTVVTLTATADSGSSFAGWSGDPDCSDGVVTMDTNKICTATFTVILPDLIMTAVTPNASTVSTTATLSVTNSVKNQGGGSAGSFVVGFNLSPTASYTDPGAVAITTTRTVSSLAAGATSTATTTLTIPNTTPPGNYYVCAKADKANAVAEVDETNNTLCSAATVTVPPADLIMSAVSTTATLLAPGNSLSLSNTAKNQGLFPAGSFTIAFHLSTNTTYGDGDDVAFSTTRTISSLAVGATNAASTGLTIPAGTPLGTYYICAMADSGNTVTESNENNNSLCTSTTIQVTRPDLIETAVTPNASTVNQGATLSVTDTVKNQGLLTTATSFRMGFHLSTNTTYGDGDDVAITTIRSVSALAAGASSTGTTSLTIPSTTPPGMYYVCALADSITQVIETDETNNTLCSTAQVTVPPPDLIMSAASTTATTVAKGASFALSNSVKNQGGSKAGAFVIAFHLSTDTTYGNGDDVVITQTRSVSSLAIGATSTASTTLTVPNSTSSGTYYVCAMADNNNTVAEGNETNNSLCTSTTITVP